MKKYYTLATLLLFISVSLKAQTVDDIKKEDAIWPMPKFRFEVDLGPKLKGIAFQEVSGMDGGNVTMKRGVFVNDNTFWDWNAQISMNTIERTTIIIKLLDENGKVTMQWQLNNAWPTKISSTDLKSDGNEVAVDTIEIKHEGIIISNK